MLLLDTSFLIEFEKEIVARAAGPATDFLASRRSVPIAISIVTFGEFAEEFGDPREFGEFVNRFRVIQLSRAGERRLDCRFGAYLRRGAGWQRARIPKSTSP